MRKKLKMALIITILMILTILTGRVNAATLEITAESNKQLKAGETVEITLKISKIEGIGINAITGTLEYDSEIFDEITVDNFEGLNRWSIGDYYDVTKKFSATKSSDVTTASDILKLTAKVKENVSVGSAEIKFVGLDVSDGNESIEITSVPNTIKEETEKPTTNTITNEIVNEVANEVTNKVNTVVNQTTNKITSNVTNSNTSTGKLPQTGEGVGVAVGIAVVTVIAVVAFMKYRNLNIK